MIIRTRCCFDIHRHRAFEWVELMISSWRDHSLIESAVATFNITGMYSSRRHKVLSQLLLSLIPVLRHVISIINSLIIDSLVLLNFVWFNLRVYHYLLILSWTLEHCLRFDLGLWRLSKIIRSVLDLTSLHIRHSVRWLVTYLALGLTWALTLLLFGA